MKGAKWIAPRIINSGKHRFMPRTAATNGNEQFISLIMLFVAAAKKSETIFQKRKGKRRLLFHLISLFIVHRVKPNVGGLTSSIVFAAIKFRTFPEIRVISLPRNAASAAL